MNVNDLVLSAVNALMTSSTSFPRSPLDPVLEDGQDVAKLPVELADGFGFPCALALVWDRQQRAELVGRLSDPHGVAAAAPVHRDLRKRMSRTP